MAGLQPLPDNLTETLVGSLVTVVRRLIVDGDIETGGKIDELAMAQQLGVSRSALRESIRPLEQSMPITRPTCCSMPPCSRPPAAIAWPIWTP